tara:strand:+ start:2111 stop:4513 length:2403 start_codon:yes stop_codon:yes gene_type:complete
MGSVKLTRFLGEAPKISTELLPDGAAQNAFNVKLYSGDLIPYRTPKLVENVGRTGTIQTLYKLTNPTNGNNVFLTYLNDVDIATASAPWTTTSNTEDTEQRFYYTGDGTPKVSNYDLATNGSAPYPVTNGYYDLGLPLPTTTPTATAVSFSVISSTHYERDSGNTAIFYGSGNHNLRSGNIVSVRDFGTSDEAKAFNATNVEVTVLNATDFTYFSPGDAVSKTANTTGRSELAGNTQIRTYVYTWVTPWDEEAIPSLPSNEVYIKEGQTVTVSNLPQAKPSAPAQNFIRGIRLYRTVVSSAATEYFLLATLWFPTTTTKVKRVGSVVTLTLSSPHNFIVDDRFKLSGMTTDSGSMNGTFSVASIVDKYTFTFSDSGNAISETADTNGTVFHDVAESLDNTARYWGDGSFNFTDDFLISGLSIILPSEDFDPPPTGMKGIRAAHNNILVGFFDNQLCFSFPDKPHAWPERFRLTFDSDIVSVEPIQGFILVLTKEYPYQVSGNDPATMVSARIDTLYPCLSKKSVVNMGYGVLWATHGGLASYAPSAGITLVTSLIHDWDTWNTALDPATLIGHYYNGKYFGSHSSQSFIFERDDKVGGLFVSINYTFSAACTDYATGVMYYIGDDQGNLYEWDNKTQVLSPLEWKSKTIVTKDFMNLGAARIIADFATSTEEAENVIAYNNTLPAFNNGVWAKSIQLGTLNGPTDYTDAGTAVNNIGTLNSFPINADGQTKFPLESTGNQPVTFKLFVDKQLIFQGTVSSDEVFRLPSGYRSDTFEVGVSGSSRIRAIHIGETPYGLRTA